MSEQIDMAKGKRTKRSRLPYLGEDVLFKIFTKCHPKTIGRLRMLSHHWNDRLRGPVFARLNWRENDERDKSLMVGCGYTSYNDKSHWAVAVSAKDGAVSDVRVPIQLEDYGYYSIIGSDRGNLCVKFSKTGEQVEFMVWNPLTKVVAEVDDQSFNYWGYSVSVYAFGYLSDGWQYRVVYLFKKMYSNKKFNWLKWNSLERYWSQKGEFEYDIHKIGPTSVVISGVVYWIGWGGIMNTHPTHLIGFFLEDATFFQDEIPEGNRREFHSIAKLNKGLAFVAYQDVAYQRQVEVWSIECTEDRKFLWQKLYNIQDFGIPHIPSILHRDEVISVMDIRSTMSGSNDDRRTELVISKMKQIGGARNIIYHNGWQMNGNGRSHKKIQAFTSYAQDVNVTPGLVNPNLLVTQTTGNYSVNSLRYSNSVGFSD
ncbi:hypothetical protein PIB30_093354 [Stylosanthes scabra]|uniref:F-box domain-containing protein n=1 Tax=Stylosanthes scabra TaxID=79078 RepID=A0ABU6RVJ2_9FABA|nr:hypothetical protein [Stylosanthes scabra]